MSIIKLRENIFSRLVEFVVCSQGRVIGLRISHGDLETLKFHLSIKVVTSRTDLIIKNVKKNQI